MNENLSHKTWTIEELKEAIKISHTLKEVLINIGLAAKHSAYLRINYYIKKYNLDISHLKKMKIASNEELFCVNDIARATIRKRVIKENLIEYICNECEMKPIWNNKELALHLDHINGINNDNRLENLRFLCPNCHSQTETYAGRNNKKKKEKSTLKIKCVDCDVDICYESIRCTFCENKNRLHRSKNKIDWPKTSELIKMVEETNYLEVGRRLGVSDNAIRKRIKKHPND